MSTKKIEGFGLILILISFGWQMFFNFSTQLSGNADKYQLHTKIDNIFCIIKEFYTHSEFTDTESVSNAGYDVISNEWKDWSSLEEEKSTIAFQQKLSFWISLIAFSMGSILMIISKFKN